MTFEILCTRNSSTISTIKIEKRYYYNNDYKRVSIGAGLFSSFPEPIKFKNYNEFSEKTLIPCKIVKFC